MNDGSLRSYNAVIENTLSEAIRLASQSPKSQTLQRRGIAGFCPLQGPTGGGKTSCLFQPGHYDNSPPVLETIRRQGYQAIFVTHRWNILHEVYKNASEATDSKGESITVSVLCAQSDNLTSAVTRRPLPHEDGLTEADLPCPFVSMEEMETAGLFSKQGTKTNLVGACKKIKSLATRIQRIKSGAGITSEYLQLDEDKLGRLCAYVERLLLINMHGLEKHTKHCLKIFGAESEQTVQANARLASFRQNTWVRRIFPGIVWRDEKQHLLIMTTQKLFSSFYDGKRKVRMSSGELSGHVIFIDEFDYQADVLQQLLSQAQLVQEPPECLGQLIDAGNRLLKRLQFVKDEPIPTIHKKLSELIEDLENALADKSIDLSDARALLVPVEQRDTFKTQYLFRSDHLVTSDRLSMQRVDHGYEIQVLKTGQPVPNNALAVGDFLRLMEQYIRLFSLVVSDITVSQDEAQEYLVKLSRLLFDAANDYRPSYYSSALPSVSMFSLPRADLPELDGIRESNLLPNTHANIFGLTNWLLKQNAADADIDPLRLQIRRAFLPTTPEGLLVSVCSRNLVFGLSATSYVERAVGSFDLRWVQSALRYVAEARTERIKESFLGDKFDDRPVSWFKKPIPYLPGHEDTLRQYDVIQHIQESKKAIRQSTLTLNVDQNLSEPGREEREVIARLPTSFFNDDEITISEFTFEHRSNLLLELLGVVQKASVRSQHQGQLVFANSTRYFRKWLFDEYAQSSRDSSAWLRVSDKPLSQLLPHNACKEFKDVFVPVLANNTPMILCLLTAESQKRPHFYEVYQAAFDSGRVVLVMTQTASATNGVNLDFTLPDTGKQMDLSCLYLLESRHFYFSSTDSDDGGVAMAHAGYQLRNLEKLMRAGELSRKQHRHCILPIMENSNQGIATLNSIYKGTIDYIKNTASDIQQQIGRIERAWSYVPKVEIHIYQHLAKVLTKFATLPVYLNNKGQISDLNNQLLQELQQRNEAEQVDLLALLMTPQQRGELAEDVIDAKLVPAIRAARESGTDPHNINSIWRQLGQAVLQFDLAWNPKTDVFGLNCALHNWACIEKPADAQGHTLWYDADTWQFFAKPSSEHLRMFYPKGLYEHIQKLPAVIDWFNKRGYRTSMYPEANSLEAQYVFHPKVVQRLLQGRLGEEAIRALLYQDEVITSAEIRDVRALELFDFRVKDKPYFVDAKFWGGNTLNEADEQYHQWLNAGADPEKAPMGLVEKLLSIRRVCGNDAKLFVVNFIGRASDQPMHSFDETLFQAPPTEASIFIVDGCVTDAAVEQQTLGFEHLVRFFQSADQNGA
ncbi:MAG: hypothetical protein AAGE59_13860 [Cyanobacteria bacterium P01_F01_bin.86]